MDEWNDIGSGSQYAGSGFLNFDRFMHPENIAWGASQPAGEYEFKGNDWSLASPYDQWMINLGHQNDQAPPPYLEGGPDAVEDFPNITMDPSYEPPPDYSEEWMNSPLYNKLSQLHPDQEPQMPKGWKPTAKKPTVAKPPEPPARVPTEEEITGHPYLPGTGPQIQPGQVSPPPSYTTPQYQYTKQSASGYPTLDKYLTGAWE